MSRRGSYLARKKRVIAFTGDPGLRMRRSDEGDGAAEFALNPTAVLIWHACNGQRRLDEVVEALKADWKEYPWTTAEVEQTVDSMVSDKIVLRSGNSCDSAGIVRVGFLGMWPGFDPCNNYFLWMLSHRAVVIATDPKTSDVDILFFTRDAEGEAASVSPEAADFVRVCVAFEPIQTMANCDFTFDLSGGRLGRTDTGFTLPPWIDAIDWWGSDETKLALKKLTRDRARHQDAGAPPDWAVVDIESHPETETLVEMLKSRYGQPRSLWKPALDDRATTVIDHQAATESGFALIAGSTMAPDLAGAAMLTVVANGAIPFYCGDPRLVAGINERAYIDTSIYASTSQVVDVTDSLRRDTAFYERLLAAPAFYGNRLPAVLEPETVCDVIWQALFGEPAMHKAPVRPPAEPTAPKRLTIGMPTFDDYDGVYFSIQAARLYHPEVRDDIEFLIVDNNPNGPCGQALRDLARNIPNTRYIAHQEANGTAVSKNLTFSQARSEYVLCMDSHVFIVPGALRKLLDYYAAHAECGDLLQGPLQWDNLNSISTHWNPVWSTGMWGAWGIDERGRDADAEPFDIAMQGMGLFTCRREAWLGFHPDFRGFGAEEGYIHEKFRRAGRRTLCLPFLRWVHRFGRPMGPRYKPVWEDRVRNYFLGFYEIGLDTGEMEAHFADHLNPELVTRVKDELDHELISPFSRFDGIYGIDVNGDQERWHARITLLDDFGIAKRIRYQPAPPNAGTNDLGFAVALREIIEDARRQRFTKILVVDGDAVFHKDANARLKRVLKRLNRDSWEAVDLGSGALKHNNLDATPLVLALHKRSFDRLLERLPAASELEESMQWPTSRTKEALAGIRWATRKPAGLAAHPRQLPLDSHLV